MNENCYICLQECKKKYKLKLNCNCKYNVHPKCFLKWWDTNQNCIICLKKCEKPYVKKTFIEKRLNRINVRLRVRYRNNLTHFSIDDLDQDYLDDFQFLNQNYFKKYYLNIIFSLIFLIIISKYIL